MLPSSRTFSAALAATGAIFLATACGHQGKDAPAADAAAATATSVTSDASASSASPSGSASASASASASPSTSASASATPSGSAKPAPSGSRSAAGGGTGTAQAAPTAHAPNFPVRVDVANATQVITVKASGSYATVTAWAKGSSGWKSVITASGRVGSNGIVDGSTRRQGTYTTPSGTYTITEGFGVESGGTNMPYTRVNSSHWWVEDPQSKFYNQMHTAAGADFPLTETGDRGSEHLINYPTQYAKALVINFNRWPATPGRGAGIFLHVNGRGATAGCVSVPRSTMDRIMAWIQPGAHPRIAIG
ncbi:L,D-transpeptidase family protein [Streptomyces sp. NBC_00322]|uniref:L,D-transpeptidase family protein n=1 Tax=Streptomyces sp. NBC_00322 TaxID=2975712 RepID=UPI002E2A8265|nr:L,D-transpeptidase family protein [Streptomyces sp. NBC_00322]